ncbi:MAG: hypothetical protein EOP88_12120 [Verrucomicrobiaceae bacterium]|nr:MAG: hypothetical protein EOP88_12120 [Verrucomicrobiaceae bacterium]
MTIHPLQYLSHKAFNWIFRNNRIGNFEGIHLSSLNHETEAFLRVITRSLALIRDHDPRRFKRVKEQVTTLADEPLHTGALSASYLHYIKAVRIDFALEEKRGDEMYHAAYFAGVIVHEATHGHISHRGIGYTADNRRQVERICCAEQNRFLERLRKSFPELPGSLIHPYDPSAWEVSWTINPLKRAVVEFKRNGAKGNRGNAGNRDRR